ncbi:hypothetical protein KC959_04405, partial [Candidatus Saccharibacteria bacterium]|nr:hypothetical protein [Candidatus Saccharibacteria bacterium]
MPEIGEVRNSPGSTLTLNDLRALDEEVERQIMPAFIKLSEDESRPLIPVAHVPLRLLGDEAERAVSLIDGSIQYHVLDVYGSAGINPDFSGYKRHRLLRSRLERRICMGSPETNGVIPTLTIAPGSDSGSVNVQKTRLASVERVGISESLAKYPADWLSAFSEATGVEFEGADRFDFAVNVVADKYSQRALRDLDSAGAKLVRDPAGNQRIRKPLSEFADLYNQALLTEYTERRIDGVL